MSLLLAIDFKNGQILHPEVMKLVDAFQVLSEKEMLYVVLFTDYNSPYKQFPEHDRKRRAMWKSFDGNAEDLVSSPKIKMAIEEYTALQYNPKQEVIIRYQKKIDKFLDLLDGDDTPSSVEKTTKAINSLREQINTLQQEVDDQNRADGVIKGDRELSFLEKLIRNKKQYKAIIEKK